MLLRSPIPSIQEIGYRRAVSNLGSPGCRIPDSMNRLRGQAAMKGRKNPERQTLTFFSI